MTPKQLKRADYVTQSQPSLTRPRLRTESELKLAETDQRAARGYAQAEELTDELKALAAQVEAAPECINFDEPSAVHHIENLRRIAEQPVDDIAIPRTRSR